MTLKTRFLSLLFFHLLYFSSFADSPALSNFQSKIDGPNCHNTGLVFNRLISVRRYVSRQEMDFWLKNFCKILPRGSNIEEGDLRVWRRVQENKEDMLWHTQIILNKDTVFEKVGHSASHAYRLDKYKLQGRSSAGGASWSDAKRTLSCSWANDRPKDCYLYVTYYRCEQDSYNNLINKYRNFIGTLFGLDFIEKMEQVEAATDRFAGNYFDTLRAKEIFESATSLRSRLDQNQNDQMDSILLQSLKWRLDGIILQMQLKPEENFRETPPIEL
ncbi:hypothetical protein K2X05_07415 [bacterium]|nr:hypothetical protein [bacterium]